MQTNVIPITVKAPTYSQENVKKILKRIKILHPQVDAAGAEQYLCDLLNIEQLNEIIGNFLTFEEVEPAVSSTELKLLAERILPYNNNDIHQAVFSARNILNTTPKSLDDLIDYTTHERLQEFISIVISDSLVGIKNKSNNINTIDQLSDLLEDELSFIIDNICNTQMDNNRNIHFDDIPGVTNRQKYLYKAADYYLNHRVGFQCNSIWLACFINSDMFGCESGWIHIDGNLCSEMHFGFKDDINVVKLVLKSMDYIASVFASAKGASFNTPSGIISNATHYIDTLLSSLSILLKQRLQHNIDNTAEYTKIYLLIEDNYELLEPRHVLEFKTLKFMDQNTLEFDEEHLLLLQDVTSEYSGKNKEPEKRILPFFDACNFIVYDHAELKAYTLAPLFLKARYSAESLEVFSDTLLLLLGDIGITEQFENLFRGFFVNFLHIMINENSDTHYLFDAILKVSIKAATQIDNQHIIQTMAELGHRKSVLVIAQLKPVKERDYWIERAELINNKEF